MSVRHFAGYELLGRIATGGMAEIYLARRVAGMRFEKLVALKRLPSHFASDPNYVAMFGDEARILGCLSHPNVVQILDFGKAEAGHVYMALEYVHGETLAALIGRLRERNGALTPAQVAFLGAALARGLHHAHEARDAEGKHLGVLHRDLSPHNVIVGYDGCVKLIDFGVAHANDRDSKTERGVVKGKFCYMAPEQFGDGPVDRRADLFTLGICLWEMTSGRRLFARESDAATMRSILEGPVPELREVAPATPPELNSLVMRLLDRRPEERPATALEVARHLDGCAAKQLRFDEAALGALMNGLFTIERTRKEEMLKVALSPSLEHFLFADREDASRAWESMASSAPVMTQPHRKRSLRQRPWVRRAPFALIAGGIAALVLLAAPVLRDADPPLVEGAGTPSLLAAPAPVAALPVEVTPPPIDFLTPLQQAIEGASAKAAVASAAKAPPRKKIVNRKTGKKKPRPKPIVRL
jgi:eukaryotic-like serine/threonine-protein kinase